MPHFQYPFTSIILYFIPYAVAVIGFEPADYTVDESAGTVNFTITLISGTISKDVLVEFFTNDSTAAGINIGVLDEAEMTSM